MGARNCQMISSAIALKENKNALRYNVIEAPMYYARIVTALEEEDPALQLINKEIQADLVRMKDDFAQKKIETIQQDMRVYL